MKWKIYRYEPTVKPRPRIIPTNNQFRKLRSLHHFLILQKNEVIEKELFINKT